MEDYVYFSLEKLIRGGVCFLQVLGLPALLKMSFVFQIFWRFRARYLF